MPHSGAAPAGGAGRGWGDGQRTGQAGQQEPGSPTRLLPADSQRRQRPPLSYYSSILLELSTNASERKRSLKKPTARPALLAGWQTCDGPGSSGSN